MLLYTLCVCFCTWRQVFAINENKFPDDFLFGTATASYQVEGAWNTNGKGENIWDRYTHQYPDKILDKSNGDVACDSYNKLEEDVRLLKNMNVDFYRFSVSWSRILPKGFAYQVNADGIRYYNNLIDLLISNGITPMVTMFHWDTPQNLEYFGGFTNSLIVNWFEEYARILFDNFGDRVKFWITFNEPKQTCAEGYGIGTKAPGYKLFGIADYMCIHNVLKSHARVYHLYNNTYKETQQDPIYHYNGDYPQVVKEFVSARSKLEGFSYSRLPKFTPEEITYIKGTYDFFGLNHYTTTLVNNVDPFPIGDPSQIKDARIRTSFSPSWPKTASSWFKVVPWGFTKVLKWIKNRYGDIDIYVTENGYSDHECLNDQERINYYKQYLSALLDAIYDHKVNVKGYAAWSFLDNFEWNDGYVNRFGLYHVNFSDPQRTRTPKASLYYFKNIIKNRKLIKL